MKRLFSLILVCTAGASIAAAQSRVVQESVPGIRNFSHLETTVACAGAVTPDSVIRIKEMGFGSIINLRLADEPGAEIEAEAAAARAAGISFFHLPFSGGAPEPAVVDRFLEVIVAPGNEPAFIHCASGNRAAAMWMAKRALVDGWTSERALEEAAALGLSSEPLKTFVLGYIAEKR